MKKVILISGKARSGKDTFAEMLKKHLENEDANRINIVHFADLVKHSCEKFWNWDGKKDADGRSLLQYVGTDVVRDNNPTYWINYIHYMISLSQDLWEYFIIPDCRFPNEIDLTRVKFKTTAIRIERGGDNNLGEIQKEHGSEVSLDAYDKWNSVVHNDGTLKDLNKVAYQTVKNIRKGEI